MTEIKFLKNNEVVEKLKSLVCSERKLTAEIIEYIKEVDRRKLYLELGHTSLFGYLTKDLGYTSASAQRRIDSARLMNEIPELKEDIKSGALNLMQVSMVAQSARQKQKEDPKAHVSHQDKRELLAIVKGKDLFETQKAVAQALDLEIKTFERKTVQQDDSVRMEITLTKEQMSTLKRVKEIISHTHPNPSISELMEFLAQDYLKRKDPLAKKPMITSKMEAAQSQILQRSKHEKRAAIAQSLKREVFQRDQCCQWKDSSTQRVCGSTFQLQIDHMKPIWAEGNNELNNLQLLCSIHNSLKYKREAQIRSI